MPVLKDFDAFAWLKYSEEDLAVAELLYKHGFHRHALFWAEQASEKILKVFIIIPHAKELTSKLSKAISYCRSLGVSSKGIELLEKLYNKVKEFLDPKTFWHLCEKHITKVEEFFDIYQKAISHPCVTELYQRKALCLGKCLRINTMKRCLERLRS